MRIEKSWNQNVRKRRKNVGTEYVSKKGKLCRTRMMDVACGLKCRYKCKEVITNEHRKEIFHSFRSLGNLDLQKQFILSHAKSEKKKNCCK